MQRATTLTLLLLLSLLSACASLRSEGEYDRSRATEEMAPANPRRGMKTLRVTTKVPPELEVRLVAFYSQFYPISSARTKRLPRMPERHAPRAENIAAECWQSEFAVLQDVRSYYTRTFTYPVQPGTQVQDLLLDEVVPGKCPIAIMSVGYEVRLKSSNSAPVKRWLNPSDVGIEEGGASQASVLLLCQVRSAQDTQAPFMYCRRNGESDTIQLGPLATAGAALTLEFAFKGGIEPIKTVP